jgi:hypothetical protein
VTLGARFSKSGAGQLSSAALSVPHPLFRTEPGLIIENMLRYRIAYYLPKAAGEIVLKRLASGSSDAGGDVRDARLMIASAFEELAQVLLEEGRPQPVPSEERRRPDADFIELVPLSIHAGKLSG